MSSEQLKAKGALDRYLGDIEFLKALCFSYEAEKRGVGRLYLAPNGLGGWAWVATDTHPLGLPIPSMSGDEYLLLKSQIDLAQGDVTDLLNRVQSEVLQAWKMIAFRADEPEYPFRKEAAV